jgi:DNA-binding FadR family transcriptional regulator
MAERIAYRLEREIVAAGFPVGHVLGSEADLMTRLQISRAVLREAVRVLEHHGVATMRRGPSGGLVVTPPPNSAAVLASSLMLEFMNASPQHVFEARSALDLKCAELAAERIDEAGIALLRKTLALARDTQATGGLGDHTTHMVLAELSGNPAMVLFVEALAQLSRTGRGRTATPEAAADVRRAHDRIAEAVIAGDASLARFRMRAHLSAIGR